MRTKTSFYLEYQPVEASVATWPGASQPLAVLNDETNELEGYVVVFEGHQIRSTPRDMHRYVITAVEMSMTYAPQAGQKEIPHGVYFSHHKHVSAEVVECSSDERPNDRLICVTGTTAKEVNKVFEMLLRGNLTPDDQPA